MEPEDVVDALSVDSSPYQDLVIAVVEFLAAHDAHTLQSWAALLEFSQAYRGDVGAS